MLINVLGKFLSVCKLVRFNSTRIELHATMSLKFYVYSYHIFIHFHLFLASKMHTRFSRSRLFSTKYITICEQLNIFLLSPRLHFFVYKLCCNKAYFIALLLLNERTVFKLLHFIWNYNNFTNWKKSMDMIKKNWDKKVFMLFYENTLNTRWNETLDANL